MCVCKFEIFIRTLAHSSAQDILIRIERHSRLIRNNSFSFSFIFVCVIQFENENVSKWKCVHRMKWHNTWPEYLASLVNGVPFLPLIDVPVIDCYHCIPISCATTSGFCSTQIHFTHLFVTQIKLSRWSNDSCVAYATKTHRTFAELSHPIRESNSKLSLFVVEICPQPTHLTQNLLVTMELKLHLLHLIWLRLNLHKTHIWRLNNK